MNEIDYKKKYLKYKNKYLELKGGMKFYNSMRYQEEQNKIKNALEKLLYYLYFWMEDEGEKSFIDKLIPENIKALEENFIPTLPFFTEERFKNNHGIRFLYRLNDKSSYKSPDWDNFKLHYKNYIEFFTKKHAELNYSDGKNYLFKKISDIVNTELKYDPNAEASLKDNDEIGGLIFVIYIIFTSIDSPLKKYEKVFTEPINGFDLNKLVKIYPSVFS